MPTHQTNELLRKALHIAFGLFAFSLRILPWWAAAAVALCAILGNWLVLHRVFGKRVARHERGYDFGIVSYPVVVFLLIVVFRNDLEIAGVAWALLAFGDGFATLAGKAIGGPSLPWNRKKTWSGLVAFCAFGFVGAEAVYIWLRSTPTSLSPLAVLVGTVIASAIVESLPLNVDDNVTVPVSAAPVMLLLVHAVDVPHVVVTPALAGWLAANTLLALLGYAAKSVDFSGLAGGWLLGAIVIVFGGWPLYLVLLLFFTIGTATTRIGYRRKAKLGVAQEREGRRGFGHAFANVGVAALLVVAAAMLDPSHSSWGVAGAMTLWMAAAASLATAAADTTASEVGQLIGRRAFLPLTFRKVAPGTEGAISVEGTLVGFAAAVIVAGAAVFLRFAHVPHGPGLLSFEIRWVAAIVAAAVAGSWLESVLGSVNRSRAEPWPNGLLNFFNTAAGAAIMLLASPLVRP